MRSNLKLPKHAFLVLLLLASFAGASAQESDRERAFRLYKDANWTEALPLLEKLANANPDDLKVTEMYGLVLVSQASHLKDPAARKEARFRGREVLLRAQKLGSKDTLVRVMLDEIPPDGGGDRSFSPKKEIDDAMREGEAAFASGDMTKAIESYQRALLLDPNLYEAALFTGDVYFKAADQVKASEWFARAVAMNPDRETAYRYWGDSLMRQGKVTEAGDKFVEAYIAEPYNRLSQSAFVNWGEKVHVTLAHPKVDLPATAKQKSEKETTITLDPNLLGKKDDKTNAAAAWMTYALIRAGWPQANFAKEYPNEKTYRHSLKEEAAAMRAALSVLENKEGDASLQVIKKLDKEGLLEAFILLALPDAGIATDFPEYRKTNIENLRRYVKLYVLTGGGNQ
jgi:tetratricopeptide (TPR) repeat protein